jgi:hypothetical protein
VRVASPIADFPALESCSSHACSHMEHCRWSGCVPSLVPQFVAAPPLLLQNVVLYAGSAEDRRLIRDYEFHYPGKKVGWDAHIYWIFKCLLLHVPSLRYAASAELLGCRPSGSYGLMPSRTGVSPTCSLCSRLELQWRWLVVSSIILVGYSSPTCVCVCSYACVSTLRVHWYMQALTLSC